MLVVGLHLCQYELTIHARINYMYIDKYAVAKDTWTNWQSDNLKAAFSAGRNINRILTSRFQNSHQLLLPPGKSAKSSVEDKVPWPGSQTGGWQDGCHHQHKYLMWSATRSHRVPSNSPSPHLNPSLTFPHLDPYPIHSPLSHTQDWVSKEGMNDWMTARGKDGRKEEVRTDRLRRKIRYLRCRKGKNKKFLSWELYNTDEVEVVGWRKS